MTAMSEKNETPENMKEKTEGQGKNEFVRSVAEKKYEFGFTTDVQTEIIEKGLNEDVIRLISDKKGEPAWLLQFRLDDPKATHLGACPSARDRLSSHLILCRPYSQQQEKPKKRGGD